MALHGCSPDHDFNSGAETLVEHRRRLGRRPIGADWLLDVIERSGLRGHGGAWFPTHRKWRGVSRLALERGEPSVVVVNASEGEPLSAKDKLLAEKRPHLLIDGALIAAEAVGADDVVIYVSRPARRATRALRQAIGERRRDGVKEPHIRIVHTQHRYVAGECLGRGASCERRTGEAIVQSTASVGARCAWTPHSRTERRDDRPRRADRAVRRCLVSRARYRGCPWYGVGDADRQHSAAGCVRG